MGVRTISSKSRRERLVSQSYLFHATHPVKTLLIPCHKRRIIEAAGPQSRLSDLAIDALDGNV